MGSACSSNGNNQVQPPKIVNPRLSNQEPLEHPQDYDTDYETRQATNEANNIEPHFQQNNTPQNQSQSQALRSSPETPQASQNLQMNPRNRGNSRSRVMTPNTQQQQGYLNNNGNQIRPRSNPQMNNNNQATRAMTPNTQQQQQGFPNGSQSRPRTNPQMNNQGREMQGNNQQYPQQNVRENVPQDQRQYGGQTPNSQYRDQGPQGQQYYDDDPINEEDEEYEDEEEYDEEDDGDDYEDEDDEEGEYEEDDAEELDDDDEDDDDDGDEEDYDEVEFDGEEGEEYEDTASQQQSEDFPNTILGDILNPNKIFVNPFRTGTKKPAGLEKATFLTRKPQQKKQITQRSNQSQGQGSTKGSMKGGGLENNPHPHPQTQKYVNPFREKRKKGEYFQPGNDDIKNKKIKGDLMSLFLKKGELSDYNIAKVLLIVTHFVMFEVHDKKDKKCHLYLFDEGLNQKDIATINALYPVNFIGTPKVYAKGEGSIIGYESSYWAIVDPLPLSVANLIIYHYEKKMIFKEEELVYFFSNVLRVLVDLSPKLDVFFLTEYDIHLDDSHTKFVVTPFSLDRRFVDITQSYSYADIIQNKVKLDPVMSSMVQVFAPEILKAWENKTRFDFFDSREKLLVYCLGIILLKMALVKPEISLQDLKGIDTLILSLKLKYKTIPLLIEACIAPDPARRRSLKWLLDNINEQQKGEIPPYLTFKMKLGKLSETYWEAQKISWRGQMILSPDKLDYIDNDMFIGKAYTLALRNYDQAVAYYDLAYENLATINEVDNHIKEKYIETLFFLCIVMRETDQTEEAAEYVKELLMLYPYIYSEDDIMTARVYCEAGNVYKQLDMMDEAVEAYDKALKVFWAKGGRCLEYTMPVLRFKVDIRLATKELLKGRREIMEAAGRKEYSDRQRGEMNYQIARLLEASHLMEDTIQTLERSLYYYEVSFEPKDEKFDMMLRDLVKISMILKENEKVEMLKGHYPEKYETFIHEVRQEVMNTLEQQGAAYKVHGEYPAAIEMYERVSKLKAEVYGKKDPSYVNSLEMIANLHEYLGEYEKALIQYKNIKQFKLAVYGEGSLRITNTLISTGKCYESLGKLVEALQTYEEASQIMLVRLGDTHKDRLKILEKINSLRKKLGGAGGDSSNNNRSSGRASGSGSGNFARSDSGMGMIGLGSERRTSNMNSPKI